MIWYAHFVTALLSGHDKNYKTFGKCHLFVQNTLPSYLAILFIQQLTKGIFKTFQGIFYSYMEIISMEIKLLYVCLFSLKTDTQVPRKQYIKEINNDILQNNTK